MPTAILSALERRAALIGWGVDRWDLQALRPNRLKFLARLGKRSTNQALQRARPSGGIPSSSPSSARCWRRPPTRSSTRHGRAARRAMAKQPDVDAFDFS